MSGLDGLRFRLLGPVGAFAGTEPVELASHRPRVLLAALLLRVNQTVPIDELVEILWDELPSRPRPALQVYISRLRAAFGDTDRTLIRTTRAGYSITTDPERIDLIQFRQLVDQAVAHKTLATRAELLKEALGLWSDQPLAGLDSSALTRDLVPRLEEERLRAVELDLETRLELGDHLTAVPQLLELVERHPTREHLWSLLMRAQHASGRPADALVTYSEVSRRLAELLGTGPGPELQKIHQTLLEASEPGSVVIPNQLPIGVRTFSGRAADLDRLDQLLARAAGPRLGVVIGPAGIGKTTLAIHWARQVTDSFPDGVLYADLRGFASSAESATPASVLTRFLAGVGFPADQVPAELDEQIALFRSVLASRSVLVLLDNARSAAQVRPLLATGPRCLTVVTSRSELGGLVAQEQAEPFRLELLRPAEARQLLVARVGPGPIGQEPVAAGELVDRCAGLPLALALVAAQIGLRHRLPLAAHLRALRQTPLDALSTGGSSDLRTIFSWSYHQLSPEAARMFRLLGSHPGPDLTVEAAAALAGVPVREADRLLGELVSAHQVIETGEDSYALHDLLRSYAIELCERTEGEEAFTRLVDYYVHTGLAAALALAPTRDLIELPAPDPLLDLIVPADREQAFQWFDREQNNHLAVLRAAAGRCDEKVWQLVWTLADYHDNRGRWTSWLDSQTLALKAAIRLDARQWQAQSRRALARAHLRLQHWDEAIRQHELALGLAEELGDDSSLAHGHLGIARVLSRQRLHRRAIEHTAQALAIYERIGHRSGAANALNNIGWYHAVLAEYDQTLESCGRALRMFRELGELEGEADTLDSIAYAQTHLGHLDEAIAIYRSATDLQRALGRQYETAQTLISLGEALEKSGNVAEARTNWQQAAVILDSLNHPEAAAVHARLTS